MSKKRLTSLDLYPDEVKISKKESKEILGRDQLLLKIYNAIHNEELKKALKNIGVTYIVIDMGLDSHGYIITSYAIDKAISILGDKVISDEPLIIAIFGFDKKDKMVSFVPKKGKYCIEMLPANIKNKKQVKQILDSYFVDMVDWDSKKNVINIKLFDTN